MIPLQSGLSAVLQDRHYDTNPNSRDPEPSETFFDTDSEADMPARVLEEGDDPLRVIIIGAGLGGLTLAQLLMASPGIRVTCYERSATLDDRLTGFRVMLSGSTLTTLKGKLWNEVWSHIALSIGEQPEGGQKLDFFKSNGDKLFSWDSDPIRDQFSVARWQLREGLLRHSEPFLRVGKCFERYEELPKGGVRVYFSDGSTDECDLLVGADGWNSRVKKQLLPLVTVKHVDMAIIYFKIPLTPKSVRLLESPSGSMTFCPRKQNIILGVWQNPLNPWATRFTPHTIEPEESYIMIGLGSPTDAFLNRRATPDRLSLKELKAEVVARTANNPAIDPRYAELAQMTCTNTAFVHMVRKCEAVKPWASQQVTLLGDSVFNMSNMLGKGANCALLDAVSLAETISSPKYNRRAPARLTKYVTENIERRQRERQRSALMNRIAFFGENKLKGFVRDRALPYALRRIDGLDREVHDTAAGDWALDDAAWKAAGGHSGRASTSGSGSTSTATSETWAEELRWEHGFDEDDKELGFDVHSSVSTAWNSMHTSRNPSTAPSRNPSTAPSRNPSTAPSRNPSTAPSRAPSPGHGRHATVGGGKEAREKREEELREHFMQAGALNW